MPKISIPVGLEQIRTGTDFIEETCAKYKLKHKMVTEAVLLTEESLVRLMDNAESGDEVQISVRPSLGTILVTMSCKGTPFTDSESILDLSSGEMDHASEDAIRSMLMRAFADKLSYYRRGDHNYVKLHVGAKEKVYFLKTIIAFLLAVFVSFVIVPLLPASAEEFLAVNLLEPIQQIFMNALNLVTGPAVFFSIMASFSRYSSFSDPGKVSLKVIVGYVLTSIAAMFLGVGVVRLAGRHFATAGVLSMLAEDSGIIRGDGSTIDLIVNFVPSNIIEPFLNTDAVQLMVTALLGGIALGKAGQYSELLRNIADALDKFFSKTVELVSAVTPVVVFFTTVLMAMRFDFSFLISFELFATTIGGFAAMLVFYALMILVITRLNPLKLFRKYWPTMRNTFFGGSSINAIPDTMRCCERELGISPKVHSFSIPFGAIANLDGNCIYLSIAGIFIAGLCGVPIEGKSLFTLLFMVIILSVGAPITPGSTVLSIAILLGHMGISLSAISLFLGINALIEMMLTICNTTGDVAISLVVADTEKLLDRDLYNK